MASSKSQSTTKRLLSELKDYHSDPNDALLQLGPVSDDELMHWSAVMKGLTGTPYEGGRWKLDILIPSNYPLAPPDIKFVNPICHPNVNFKTGEICLDTLKEAWTPIYTVSTTLTSVQQLLTSADPDSPLNMDIAMLYRQGDQVGAEALIRFYTENERWGGR